MGQRPGAWRRVPKPSRYGSVVDAADCAHCGWLLSCRMESRTTIARTPNIAENKVASGGYRFHSTNRRSIAAGVFRMAWERRKDAENRYYYRSKRLADGRVVKTYHGTGQRGALAADADRHKRAKQNHQLQRHRALLEHI